LLQKKGVELRGWEGEQGVGQSREKKNQPPPPTGAGEKPWLFPEPKKNLLFTSAIPKKGMGDGNLLQSSGKGAEGLLEEFILRKLKKERSFTWDQKELFQSSKDKRFWRRWEK